MEQTKNPLPRMTLATSTLRFYTLASYYENSSCK